MRILGIAVIAVLAACSPSAHHSSPAPDASVSLTVRNSASGPVKVYQMIGDTRSRLDVVQVHDARTFKLTPRADNTYVLYVTPFASTQGYILGPIPAQRGDRIDVNLQDYLPLSMFSVKAH